MVDPPMRGGNTIIGKDKQERNLETVKNSTYQK
jgi:hypothetical protein